MKIIGMKREQLYMSLGDLISKWQGKKILVAGDPAYDVYHFGHVDRVSPEAPVPVFVEDSIENRPGMAYNVCQNLAALGCVPVQCFPPEPWTVKRRFMVGNHQLLRADYDQIHKPDEGSNQVLGDVEALVLSDYLKGWLQPWLCDQLISQANARGIPVIVDPKGDDWVKYRGATLICPNTKEWELVKDWETTRFVLKKDRINVLEKRGAQGLRLHSEYGPEDFPATAKHTFDVTGAGDTVVATLAAALAAGASLASAAQLANLAAGHVVGEVGTASCSSETLKRLIP